MLLGLVVYGYATGVFSSRKLERATYDSVAFRFIAANDHPDHDTIATFRRRFLKDIEKLFVEVLQLAREMGVLKMGTIGLDGTKIHANASRPQRAFLRARGEDRGTIEGRGRRFAGQGRGGGQFGCSRRDVDPRPTGAAREGKMEGGGARARSGMRARRRSTKPKWRRARPGPPRWARSPGASRQRRRPKGRCRRIR